MNKFTAKISSFFFVYNQVTWIKFTRPTKWIDNTMCTFTCVFLLLHWAPNSKVVHIIPPHPRPASFIGNSEHANLNQVLNHNIFAVISNAEILLWIWCAISAMIDTLWLALFAQDKSFWTIPCDIVRGELGVTPFLKGLSYSSEAPHEVHLHVTFSTAFIIAVCPELILHTLIRMGQRFPPVQKNIHHFSILQCFPEVVSKSLGHKCRRNCDVLNVLCATGFWRIHCDQRLDFVVGNKNCCSSSILCIPSLGCEVAVCTPQTIKDHKRFACGSCIYNFNIFFERTGIYNFNFERQSKIRF